MRRNNDVHTNSGFKFNWILLVPLKFACMAIISYKTLRGGLQTDANSPQLLVDGFNPWFDFFTQSLPTAYFRFIAVSRHRHWWYLPPNHFRRTSWGPSVSWIFFSLVCPSLRYFLFSISPSCSFWFSSILVSLLNPFYSSFSLSSHAFLSCPSLSSSFSSGSELKLLQQSLLEVKKRSHVELVHDRSFGVGMEPYSVETKNWILEPTSEFGLSSWTSGSWYHSALCVLERAFVIISSYEADRDNEDDREEDALVKDAVPSVLLELLRELPGLIRTSSNWISPRLVSVLSLWQSFLCRDGNETSSSIAVESIEHVLSWSSKLGIDMVESSDHRSTEVSSTMVLKRLFSAKLAKLTIVCSESSLHDSISSTNSSSSKL